MHRQSIASLTYRVFVPFVGILLVGTVLVAISLSVAHADVVEVGCSVTELIDAINTANSNGQPDTINLAPSCTYTLTTTNNTTDGSNGLPSITSEITINGNGATIERSSSDLFRIFHVAITGTLTLNDISIANGNPGDYRGGGVYNEGVLNVNNCTFSGNRATYGGGIYNESTEGRVNISNSTFFDNEVTLGGGGICHIGTLDVSVNNCTLSGNTASFGGGIYSEGPLNVSHSTIYSNTSTAFGGGIYNTLGATIGVTNTIIAGNSGENCFGTITSGGYNIESANDCGLSATGDITNSTTITTTLGPLQDNGGPTWTHALLEGSPAIDHIPYATNGCGTEYTTDQRGVGRPQPPEGSCDIGAYEYEPPEPPTPTATPTNTPTPTATPTNTPTPTPTPTVTVDVPCDPTELINAINTANGSGGATIMNLASGCTYTLTTVQDTTDGPNGLPPITSEIIINGNGATIERSSADGTPQFRIFHVARDGDLTLNNLTITNGDAGGNPGGGIYNAGTLSINNSTVSGNRGRFGGGILNSGTLSISNTTISANTGSYGGGVCGGGTLDITNSTFSGNTATEQGGGIYGGNPVSISHSTFTANTATSGGGGIYRTGGTVSVKNSIFTDNTPNNCNSPLTSQGYNLESGTDCGFIGTGDRRNATANLGPLQNNGGPTWTHALLAGSQAIDQIPPGTNGCGTEYTTDQRGADRANGPGHGGDQCDIGAYEYDSAPCTLEGDVNNDGRVDIDDIMLVAGSWRCQSGDECYDERYDLDRDGNIDIVDIMLVVANWGNTC